MAETKCLVAWMEVWWALVDVSVGSWIPRPENYPVSWKSRLSWSVSDSSVPKQRRKKGLSHGLLYWLEGQITFRNHSLQVIASHGLCQGYICILQLWGFSMVIVVSIQNKTKWPPHVQGSKHFFRSWYPFWHSPDMSRSAHWHVRQACSLRWVTSSGPLRAQTRSLHALISATAEKSWDVYSLLSTTAFRHYLEWPTLLLKWFTSNLTSIH